MRAPGEGEISSAVDRKPGATGSQEGLESDLDKYVFLPLVLNWGFGFWVLGCWECKGRIVGMERRGGAGRRGKGVPYCER